VLLVDSIGNCVFTTMVGPGFSIDVIFRTAGKDATNAFFGLHRQEVLYRPQYARLQIGTIKDKEPQIKLLAVDAISQVPYAEPSWLAPGFSSPYYNESHRRFQKAMRKLVNEVVLPDAIACEENGRRISQQVVDRLGCVLRAMTYVYLYHNVLIRGYWVGKQISSACVWALGSI
jgi:hypothetical protein